MVDFFKPIQLKENYRDLVCLNDFGEKILDKSNTKPFVFYYDNENNNYYLMKVKEIDNDGVLQSHINKWEKVIRNTESYYVDYTNFKIDCSQIFVMNKNDFESLISEKGEKYNGVLKFLDYYIWKTLDGVKNCIQKKSPYLSILKLEINDNKQIKPIQLALSNEKNIDKIIVHNNEKNQNDFCLKFLEKYYPYEIDNFIKIQKHKENKNEWER